jgi:magnesium transporter
VNTTDVARGTAINVRKAIATNTPKAVELWFDAVDDPAERARQLARLSPADLRRLGELLDTQTAAKLIHSVDVALGAKMLKALPNSRVDELLAAINSHRAAAILRHVDRATREALLTAMPLERANVLRGVLSWPADSVAAHILPETLTAGPEVTAAQAIDEIRNQVTARGDDPHPGSYLYVCGPEQHLIGMVRFRSLVLAPADQMVTELVEDDAATVSPLTDAEEAANLLTGRRVRELPVVDGDGRLIGILTEDEAFDILEEEATADAERQGGSAPLEVPYLRASPWLLWRKRIVWLLVLFAAEAYTGTVLRAFADEMEAVVALAFFIPLLIGTGGNTGTQITTTLVRAMGTGQVRLRDLPAILTKELSTGVLIAIAMAAAAVVRAWTLGVGPQITLTVSLTVAAIVMWSAFVASILPPVLKKLRVDPAVVSAPMIATIVDGTGLMIYFVIAHLTLPQLAGL